MSKELSIGEVSDEVLRRGVLRGYGHVVHDAALHLCVAGANTDYPAISKLTIDRVSKNFPIRGSVTFTRLIDGQQFRLQQRKGKYTCQPTN